MKKVLSLLFVLLLCLSLCACGKSEEVKNVEAMIKAVGTVTPENLEEAYAAMTAYDALSHEDAEKVKNYEKMASQLDAYLTEQVVGAWVYEPKYFYNVEEMYEKVDLTLNADGSAVGSHVTGPWRVENGVVKVDSGKSDYWYYTFYDNGKLRLGSTNSKMIPTEEYTALLDDMFVIVEINENNVADYCEVVIYTEIDEDDFGVITGDTSTYATLVSKVYDDGLYYLDGSDDLAIELLIPEHTYQYQSHGRAWRTQTDKADEQVIKHTPFGSHGYSLGHKSVDSEYEAVHDITADQISFGRVTGKITFIRSEYVQELKKDPEHTSRVLVLYNGEEMNAGTWREGLNF